MRSAALRSAQRLLDLAAEARAEREARGFRPRAEQLVDAPRARRPPRGPLYHARAREVTNRSVAPAAAAHGEPVALREPCADGAQAPPPNRASPLPSRAETSTTRRARRPPSRSASRKAGLELVGGALGDGARVRLVDDEDVRQLEHARLHELEQVARARLRRRRRACPRGPPPRPRSGRRRPSRSARRSKAAASTNTPARVALGEAAEPVARRHRAQEDARVARRRAHAHAIAEQRAAAARGSTDRRRRCRRLAARARRARTSASSSVDLPTPGAPAEADARRSREAQRSAPARRAARAPRRVPPGARRRRGSGRRATRSRASPRAEPRRAGSADGVRLGDHVDDLVHDDG